jgi:tape measure domain-containing protein
MALKSEEVNRIVENVHGKLYKKIAEKTGLSEEATKKMYSIGIILAPGEPKKKVMSKKEWDDETT